MLSCCKYAGLIATLGAVLALGACAGADVDTKEVYDGSDLSRPELYVVGDFPASPDDVDLDGGIFSRFGRMFDGESSDQERSELARDTSLTLSHALVAQLQDMGLQAVYVPKSQPLPAGKRIAHIDGAFQSIDEGNSTRRTLIGLGMGQSEVDVRAVLSYIVPGKSPEVITKFKAEGSSGHMPGLAASGAAGAAAGTVATSAAVGGAMHATDEMTATSSASNASEVASALADELEDIFDDQDWLD